MKRMRGLSAAFVVLVSGIAAAACSSSNKTSGNGSMLPECQGTAPATGPGSAACNSCLTTSCDSAVSAVDASCSAYLACYTACQCSDINCISACASAHVDSACQPAFAQIQACIGQSCATPCNG